MAWRHGLPLGIWVALLFFVLAAPAPPIALEPSSGDKTPEYEAIVRDVLSSGRTRVGASEQPYQKLSLEIDSGPQKGRIVTTEVGTLLATNEAATYAVGDRVVVAGILKPDGSEEFLIIEYVRRPAIYAMLIAFAIAVMVVGRWQGFNSLLGLSLSIIVIVKFLISYVLAGYNPVTVAIGSGLFIAGSTLFLSHGFNLKSLAACLGVGCGLLITGVLAAVFGQLGRFTGLAVEEAVLLKVQVGQIDLQGLLLAGIIIGALGVLDDVAIGQASTVNELHVANPESSWRQLYSSAMNVGRDHIAATINTLIFAYVGASLPLILLFGINAEPFLALINREFVAVEVLRMLVGSLGILATVPLTSLLASVIIKCWQRNDGNLVSMAKSLARFLQSL